ncbi:MAG: aminomethyltransferase family protein [Chloroflexota bacterium]
MPKTTPFHPRTGPLNETMIWYDWAGYLAAPKYQHSELFEYYAVRNSAGLLDTSPLFKYRFIGSDAEALLCKALARDIRKCRVGRAQYTIWCNEAGYVVEDGVAMHVAENEYWLTAAEPNLRYFRQIARKLKLDDVQIDDISESYGILALQGPRSLTILNELTPDVADLRFFRLVETTIAGHSVTVSRTGYTGDLGYELWIPAESCVDVWDALMATGRGHNIVPMGMNALKMSRLEAGLLLLDVDFHSARYAWTDAEQDTPIELGWGWMFKTLAKDDRDFIGRQAIEAELANRTSRHHIVGLILDWEDYQRIHREAGINPPMDGVFEEGTFNLYRISDTPWEYAGYATCMIYSSLLRSHIALAKLPPDLCTPGTEVDFELQVIRRSVNVKARVAELPFFDPRRKTEKFNEPLKVTQ